MMNKKNFMLNCEVCDTRKMKEEDYSNYEKMMINTELVIVNGASKSILNRLPVMINQESTIEIPDDIEIVLKTVNGSYEITGSTMVQEHTLLLINGPLTIHQGTEEVLEKYEKISVNGSVRCPKSLEGYLGKLSVNGALTVYPDDCVLLDKAYVLDKYFPLRAREGGRYYAENRVIIQDRSVDLAKLAQKQVHFITKELIVPESLVEDCITVFDERADFVVVPDGMTLLYGDTVLNEQLVEKEGPDLYIYGSVRLDPECDIEALEKGLKKLIVKGKVTLRRSQESAFRKLAADYDRLEISWEGRTLENKASIRIDKSLLESTPEGVRVRNIATIKVAEDVTPQLIMDRLSIANCAKISCSEEQESAIAAIAQNVAKIGDMDNNELEGILTSFKDLLTTKIINAENYSM